MIFFTTRRRRILNANFETSNKAIRTSAFPRPPLFGFGQSDSESTPRDRGQNKAKGKDRSGQMLHANFEKFNKAVLPRSAIFAFGHVDNVCTVHSLAHNLK
jgi:hypothetical protein